MRLVTLLATLGLLVVSTPVAGQVVETSPNPPRTDQPVTLYFNADEGTGGLADHDGDVYVHTGISTDQNAEEAWKCVKNNWPTSDAFTGNRSDTKLTEVSANRYKLEIEDIRAYYQDTSTSCSLADDEKIQTMNMVFRNADGSKEAKGEGGSDIFVEVNDIGEGAFLAANLLSPRTDPFLAATDTTIDVTVTADTANLDSFSEIRLSVDGSQVASTGSDSLTYERTLDTPGQLEVQAVAEATADGNPLRDTVETTLIRTPDVQEEPRPTGVEDGINYASGDPSTVTLSLYAPGKDFVYAIGDFSDWEIDNQYFMKRDGDHWWVTLNLNTGRQYDFQYFVDGEVRVSDPFAHKVRSPQDEGISEDIYPGLEPYPEDETDGLVSVIRPDKQQDDFPFSDFQPPEREELVVYELLLRDFVEKNSFEVLTDTLDYLDRLGVNAVELMPVANFGGNNSWGYNPNAHLALDKSYGPPEDFKRFVEEAHSRGIAVIMDVVYNHVTSQSPLAQLYGSNVENPFLEPQPGEDPDVDRGFCDDFFSELNHGSPFIKRYIDRANRYWIEEFNVDGFRFDLAKCVADDGVSVNASGYTDAVTAGWKDASDYVWNNVDPDTYMILEFFGSPSVENELGGYKDDDGNTGSMMTWHNMNRSYSQADMGFVEGEDFSSNFSASYYGNRGGYDQASYIPYMESHDEQWLMRRKKAFGNESGDYSTQTLETALNRQKLSGAFYFTVPGPRMLWQFGELGYGWGENECLKESDACSANDPGRTAPKPIRWDYRNPEENPNRVKLYKTWSALINLRTQHEVFSSLQTDVTMRVGDGNAARRIVLEHDSMDAVVIGNFGVQAVSAPVKFPSSGTWYDYFAGREVTINEDEIDTPVSLAPGEFHVFTSEKVATPDSGLVPFSGVAPPPEPPTSVEAQTGTDAITLSWEESPSSDVIGYALYRGPSANFDTTGRRIATLAPGTTEYTDTSVSQGEEVHYRLVSRDDDGERSVLTQSVSAVRYPQTLRYEVSRTFGEGSRPQDYRLVALPGQVDRPLEQTLSGSAGDAWQAYWDNGSDSDFYVQFDGSDTFTFEPGRGFWLISDSSWSVDAEVATVPLQQGNVTTIPLHAGWNIISNPFDRRVSWNAVRNANSGSLQPLWAFTGSFQQAPQLASASSGEAFYFLNDQGLDQLTIPYGEGASGSAINKSASGARTLSLQVGREGQWASTVEVGWSPDARDGLDPLDWVAPPNRFANLSLRARSQSNRSSRKQLLARTVRAPYERGQSVPLVLNSASEETVALRLKNPDVAEGQQIHLLNEETGTSYDLRQSSTAEIQPSTETTRLTLLIGTDEYVQQKKTELTASELQLQPGVPNPFRQKTTLSYTVPEEGRVKLEVFDVLGRRVRVLVDGRKEAGTYRATWNGGNEAGQAVASGVYLSRLTFEGRTITQKMVLVK